MYLTHEICHLLRVMCQSYHVLTTCYPMKTWTQIARAQIRKLLLSLVLLLVYRICGMQRRGTAFTKIGTRQVASTPRQTAAPETGPVSREIFFRSLKINGVEINRAVCIYMRRRRVAAVPDASTRAFTLQRQPDAYRSRPLRTLPDVV